MIGRALEQKKKGMVKIVIAAGCLAQRMGKELAEEAAGIDAVVALSERDNIANIIKQTLAGTDECGFYPASGQHSVSDDSGRILLTGPGWGYLRISEGCNRKCSFCTIPSIRGPFRSKPLDDILREANELAGSGVGELILIAQDSSGYGKDLGIKNGLIKLIGRLEEINGLKWIRLMYLYPSRIDDELIETIAASKKVVNYIDMPIQHINDRILRDMRRADTEQKTRALIEKLRDKLETGILKKCPDAMLNGDKKNRLPNTTNISFEYIEGEAILLMLDKFGICASSGSACTSGSLEPSHVLRAMGIPFTAAHGSIRFSLSRYNTEAEVDFTIEKMPEIVNRLRDLSPFVKK